MSDRWVLNRAGILNVYQYGDEVLEFGGGRLLLRGVNGSGKSTAMNMLLPFLLDADTRRIDAAGVQSGVLRSWMLTGREEQQPVGYLWLEVARGDQHLVFGCGIRANRSTDNVSTWWFITDRRPHIDVNLVEGRTPRSMDSLRDALGPQSQVFAKDQRNAYRSELRNRLYGGADLDQHIRLLHVLRNPTVGDRIDTELERYLDDALPQLSEQAIDDAAQPLEDLEEHRRNVAQLTTTDDAIRSLVDTYGTYARGELHAAAGQATEAVDEVATLRRRHDRLAREARDATAAVDEARERTRGLEQDVRRFTSEIAALEAQPLYREGQSLEDLRGRVVDQADRVDAEARHLAAAQRRRTQAADDEQRASAATDEDHDRATAELSRLRAVLDQVAVDARPADLAAIERDEHGIPPADIGTSVITGLGAVSNGITQRQGDVELVRRHLGAVAMADSQVAQHDATVERARGELTAAEEALGEARVVASDAVDDLRRALDAWTADAATTADGIETSGILLPHPPVVAVDTDLRGERAEVRARAARWVQEAHRLVERELAQAEHAAATAATVEDEARRALQDLLDRSEPDPPTLAWQTPTAEVRLAALVDFRDDVGAGDRLGLEAALEASGLLAATVSAGELRLASGDLVVLGDGPRASSPLSDRLVVTLPADPAVPGLEPADVEAVLAAISTDVDSSASTVVTVDGRFRVGSLTGRHQREHLGLVGVTARRAALERQREQARSDLARAEADTAEARAVVERRSGQRDVIDDLDNRLPATDELDRALLAEDAAATTVEMRAEALATSERALADATTARDQAEDALRRQAATLGLPRTDDDLRDVERHLAHARDQLGTARSTLTALDRSLAAWHDALAHLARADADVASAELDHQRAVAVHQPLAARLATLEDALGADYQELLDTIALSKSDLTEAEEALPVARSTVETTVGAEADAKTRTAIALAEVEAAETEVVDHLDRLRRTLAVPGLVAAARYGLDPGDPTEGEGDGDRTPTAPAVDRSSAGVRELAGWVARATPAPSTAVNAEGVRQALRRRRDTLGNGWDAEDHQPDPALPLSVEVNGPEGRFPLADAARVVGTRLHSQRSLLDAKQTQALRNLLQGLVAKEIATKLGAARDLIGLMNDRLRTVETAHGIRVSLQWRRRDDLDGETGTMIDLLSRPPDLRTAEDDDQLIGRISQRIDDARAEQPEAPYRDLIGEVLDYRRWHQMRILLHRPNQAPQRLGRRTGLSEGEKKVVSYLPLFAAVAASCDALADLEPSAPRFVLLDDAFAKVSVDNHEKLFGLLVEMDLDFIATSERLWGTHASVPELAITEVIRDADVGVIVLEHAHWDGVATETGRRG